jgi:4-amino-4-deoxy-L-arabinose transferase-like glycosyltransferase
MTDFPNKNEAESALKPLDNHLMLKKILINHSAILIIILAYLFFTIRYWRRWGDIIVDYGREVYIPWCIYKGNVLYRDIDYINGPLAPYINALWFNISGSSITTLFIYNLIIIAILTYLIFNFIRKTCDKTTATLSCLVFLMLFAFSPSPTNNFISPYDHDLTYGFFFAVLMIYFLFNYQSHPRLIKIACAGLCLGLVFLTKSEVFIAVMVTAVISIIINEKTIKSKPHSLHLLIFTFLVSVIIPILLFMSYFCTKMPLNQALRGVSGNWHFILNAYVLSSEKVMVVELRQA